MIRPPSHGRIVAAAIDQQHLIGRLSGAWGGSADLENSRLVTIGVDGAFFRGHPIDIAPSHQVRDAAELGSDTGRVAEVCLGREPPMIARRVVRLISNGRSFYGNLRPARRGGCISVVAGVLAALCSASVAPLSASTADVCFESINAAIGLIRVHDCHRVSLEPSSASTGHPLEVVQEHFATFDDVVRCGAGVERGARGADPAGRGAMVRPTMCRLQAYDRAAHRLRDGRSQRYAAPVWDI